MRRRIGYQERKQIERTRINNLRLGIGALLFLPLLMAFGTWHKAGFTHKAEAQTIQPELISPVAEASKSAEISQNIPASKSAEIKVELSPKSPKKRFDWWPKDKVQQLVKQAFPGKPEMLKIQGCEDGWKSRDENGKPFPEGAEMINVAAMNTSNKDGSMDVGVFQINSIHRKRVEKMFQMSFEEAMTDPVKNIAYAVIKHREEEYRPWKSSKHCHGYE